jgi:hypothetical protein
LSNVIKEAKKMYYNTRILTSDNKCKATWNIIKEITGQQHTKTDLPVLKVDHKHITNPEEIAETFNNYFSLQGNDNIKPKSKSKLNNKTEAKDYFSQDDKLYSSPLVLKTFSTKEISAIIKSIKTKNTYGYDEVSTKMLKIISNYITSPLTYICNKIILSGSFPDRLKYSIVRPIYKKGDRTNHSNYRPISLLTSFPKIFEKAIYTRLTEYLINNKILSDNQYGFWKGLATENAIFKLISVILNNQNNKTKTGSVFCDLQKAFDTVNHALLLDKLEYYGIKGKAKKLIESYLRERYQRVQITTLGLCNKTLSNWTKINQGVPQGSILGPLLFLIYINDLPKVVEPTAIPIMFADDTSIIMENDNSMQLQNEINMMMNRINEWFQDNLITLNLNKTYFIQFINKSSNNLDFQIKIGNTNITTINEIMFLGLKIDDRLSWKGHMDYIIPRLNSACYCMRAIKPYVLQNTLKLIYYSHFHSIMTYGLIFWGSSTGSIKIFKLQKKIIRIMMGYRRDQSCREVFRKLGILPLPSQYIFSLLIFLSKNRNQFTANFEVHNYTTRQQINFHLPAVSLTKCQRGIGFLGAKVFNKLPQYLKEQFDNPKKFKQSLKNYLSIKTFYSLQEYLEM